MNAFLNNAMSVVGNTLIIFSDKFGRRRVLSGSYFMGGVCCLLSMIFATIAGDDSDGIIELSYSEQDIDFASLLALLSASAYVAIVGRLFATLTFSMIYIVTSESYATSVR